MPQTLESSVALVAMNVLRPIAAKAAPTDLHESLA